MACCMAAFKKSIWFLGFIDFLVLLGLLLFFGQALLYAVRLADKYGVVKMIRRIQLC